MSRLIHSLSCSPSLATRRCGANATDASAIRRSRRRHRDRRSTAAEQPIARFIRVSGTLTPQEDAEVAAEIAGRVVATPVERGSLRRRQRLADSDCRRPKSRRRRAKRRPTPRRSRRGSASPAARRSTSNACPKWPTPRPPINSRRTTSSAPRRSTRTSCCRSRISISAARRWKRPQRQYDVARNGAAQQYQALIGARARVTVAQKALADTVVRAPFAGAVGERFVSVGDYVTRGTKVASVCGSIRCASS